MLKEACFHKCPFIFDHFHVCSNSVRGTFKKIQCVMQWASLSHNLKGREWDIFLSSLIDRLQQGSAGDVETGDLCPSSRSPCNSMQLWASHITLIS